MNVPVTIRENPFEHHLRTLIVDRKSLREIAREALPTLFDEFCTLGIIAVNGQPIPREWWIYVRPKQNSVVEMYWVPQGDKSGGILGTLAAVALVAATGGIAAFGIPFLGIAGGTFAASAVAAGIGVAGSLAISALTAPPIAPNVTVGPGAKKDIAGIALNSPALFEYLPRVLGQFRVAPPPLAPPYTELDNGEVYANTIVGLAGAYEIGEILINGSNIALFEEISYSTRRGLQGDDAPDMSYSVSVKEQQPNFKLSQVVLEENSMTVESPVDDNLSKQHVYSLPPPGDDGKFVIRLLWPGGMSHIDSDLETHVGAVAVRVEIKKQTDFTWYKLPELHFRGFDKSSGEVRQHIILQWVPSISSSDLVPNNNFAAWGAYYQSNPGGTFERFAESIYDGAAEEYAKGVTRDGKDGFIIDIDNTVLDGDVDYDVRIRISHAFRTDSFNTATWNYGGDADRSAFFNYYSGGSVNAREGSPAGIVYLESIASWRNEDAFQYRGIASIAVRARGVVIDSISALFQSIVPTYEDGSWQIRGLQWSNNPAELYRDVLLGPYTTEGIAGEIIDEDELVDWHAECVAQGYECNAVIQNTSWPQVLQLIASAGWASPRKADRFGVVMERDTTDDPPTQMLTPLNSRDLGTTKEFTRIPDAIRAEFYDEDDSYKIRDDVIVYAPGHDENTAQVIESVRYDGITDSLKAEAAARRDIKQLYYRNVQYVREVHHEGIVSPRGALIQLNDEVIEQAQRYSWIKSVTTSGPNVTGLVLEAIIDLDTIATDIGAADPEELALAGDPGSSFTNRIGLVIRLDDGSPSQHEINEDAETDTVTFVTPVTNDGSIHADQLVAIGVLGFETRRVKVIRVEPGENELFRLVMVDEAPEIHVVET